jgi:xanthine/CO dehydrogenase XdhC/CoxF family maturation factor
MFLEGKIATKKELEKGDMPKGININAEGPEEIAISILANLIAIKNG